MLGGGDASPPLFKRKKTMAKVKRIEDFNSGKIEYIGISVVFVFSPKSEYSKLSGDYKDSKRVKLAETVKKDSVKRINSLFKEKEKPSYNWFDSETEHLSAYPSVLEIGGIGVSDNGLVVGEKELGEEAKKLNAELSDRMGRETSCVVNFYIVTEGGVVLASNFKTK